MAGRARDNNWLFLLMSDSNTNWLRLAIGTGAALVLSYVFFQNKKAILKRLGIEINDSDEEELFVAEGEGRKRKAEGILMREAYHPKMNRSVEEIIDPNENAQ